MQCERQAALCQGKSSLPAIFSSCHIPVETGVSFMIMVAKPRSPQPRSWHLEFIEQCLTPVDRQRKKFGKKWRNGANCSSPKSEDSDMNKCTLSSQRTLEGGELEPSWRVVPMLRAPTIYRIPGNRHQRLAEPFGNGANGRTLECWPLR